METILVGVCTYKRPQMLAACLQGIAKQIVPETAQLHVVVVDNDVTDIVTETAQNIHNLLTPLKKLRISAEYVQEPRRGISYARNAVLVHSQRIQADYIAFIDDDEIPADNWISELYNALLTADSDGVQGIVFQQTPDGVINMTGSSRKAGVEGATITKVTTGNVIFRAKLVKEWQLDFNPVLGLSGGEDTDFFRRAQHKGARFVFTKQAIVTETVPLERVSFDWQMRQAMNVGSFLIIRSNLEHGRIRTILKYIPKIFMRFFKASYYMITSLFVGKNRLKKALMEYLKIFGIIRAILGFPSKKYRIVTGY